MTKQYVQYGCGLVAPKEWINFDISPTLKLQKMPFIGFLLKNRLNTLFPSNVLIGNIVAGLPVKDNSCDGLFCSHVLEHLSLFDFRLAVLNSYKILKHGGLFRCVVPDLEYAAKTYIQDIEKVNELASIDFIGNNTALGYMNRPKGIKGFLVEMWGNSRHLWMWDTKSLSAELRNVGFISIRSCKFGDCEDPMFQLVENETRFVHAVAIECRK